MESDACQAENPLRGLIEFATGVVHRWVAFI
jgi:hypothetical protein